MMISSTFTSSSSSSSGSGAAAGIEISLIEDLYRLDVLVLNCFFTKLGLMGLEMGCASRGFIKVAGEGVSVAVEDVGTSFGRPLILTPCLFLAILMDFEDMVGEVRAKERENKDFKVRGG